MDHTDRLQVEVTPYEWLRLTNYIMLRLSSVLSLLLAARAYAHKCSIARHCYSDPPVRPPPTSSLYEEAQSSSRSVISERPTTSDDCMQRRSIAKSSFTLHPPGPRPLFNSLSG